MTEDIRVNFVIRKDCKNETECSEDMQIAFSACEQHCGGGLQACWIRESEYNKFQGLTKKDVFVLNEFAGEIFDKLRKTKCLLIGPRCLSCCLTEGTPIPLGSEPVFTIAMRGLVVTASGLNKQEKEKVKRKVEWMGGTYTNILSDDTTHLVSNTVLSDKYIIAAEKDIPIMSETWLPAVWEASLQQNINGSSSEFNDHRLPPFASLEVTTSGLNKKEKQKIMKIINENGGHFSGAFQSEATDVVVLNKEGVGSEKYKAAVEYNKACVSTLWVEESVQRRVCLPFSRYTVLGASTSSPLNTQHKLPDMSLNFSRITNIKPMNNYIDETKSTDLTTTPRLKISQDIRKPVDKVDKAVAEAFDSFDMTLVKKAGPVFDGFNIWVVGPEGAWREKACAIISKGGGVRYESPDERVSHCIAGSASCAETARSALTTAVVVSPLWLIDSVTHGNVRDDAQYAYHPTASSPPSKSARLHPEISSPLSKRNLQLLRKQTLDLPPPQVNEDLPIADDLVNHYKSQTLVEDLKERVPDETTSKSKQPDLTDDLDDPTETVEQIFRGDLRYSLEPWLMTPILNAVPDSPTDRYTKWHCKARNTVERANGYLKGSFRCILYDRALHYSPYKASELIYCCAILYNMKLHYRIPMDEPEEVANPVPMIQEPLPQITLRSLGEQKRQDLITRHFNLLAQLLADNKRRLKIEVESLCEEDICELGAEISAAGGCLISAGSGGHYVLVPLDAPPNLHSTATPVTVFWIKDCLAQQELLPVEYYHKPVSLSAAVSENPPLAGVVASLSTYSGVERAFLDELAKLLGAVTQLRFCRRTTPTALASTHLICPCPEGDKYRGAVKWGVPAVTAQWLVDCVTQGRRLAEGPYLVGGALAPQPSNETKEDNITTDQSNRQQPTDIDIDKQTNAQTDKENNITDKPILQGKGTPRNKLLNDNEPEMSPASRYIAMARQGLLGCDSQETPKRIGELKDQGRQDADGFRTPPLDDALSTPNLRCLSPTTRRRLTAIKKGEVPSGPINTPTDPFAKGPVTPDSGFGAALRPGSGKMSPESRKRLWTLVDQLPTREPTHTHNTHTPLSEIRNRFLAQFNSDAPTPPVEHNLEPRTLKFQERVDTPPPAKIPRMSDDKPSSTSIAPVPSPASLPPAVHVQLQRLSAALDGLSPAQRRRPSHRPTPPPDNGPNTESEPAPESQPNTVGWDDSSPATKVQTPITTQVKKFMLSSNVDNREEICEMIYYLGGEVVESSELEMDSTHLLCTAPSRSEKMLGSIAAGKWVLHPKYIVDSRLAGKFLNEEEYEWGNPVAVSLPPCVGGERGLGTAGYRWRGRGGAYRGEVVLLHVPPPRRGLLARLVRAGGGTAPDIQPPYNDESVTVCFADVKRYPISERDKNWLISHKIPVCAPVLLSSYLTEENRPNPRDHCLPEFRIT